MDEKEQFDRFIEVCIVIMVLVLTASIMATAP